MALEPSVGPGRGRRNDEARERVLAVPEIGEGHEAGAESESGARFAPSIGDSRRDTPGALARQAAASSRG